MLQADSHIACRAHAMLCRYGFRMCPSHLIYTVRPCLIHICRAAPMPCSDHAALLKATAQHSCRETACGLPTRVRLLPATMRSSTKVIRSTPISDAGGQSNNHTILDYNNTVTHSLNHIALVRGCFPYWTASVRYLLLMFSHLNLSPYNPPPPPLPIANGSRTYVDRPSVTGASEPNKQQAQKLLVANTKTYTYFCAVRIFPATTRTFTKDTAW
jgi:hypothetical protein